MNTRGFICLAFFFLSLGLPPGVYADDTVTALQAKHKAFTGWTFGDGTLKTLDTTDTVTVDKDGKTARTEHTLQMGVLSRTDTHDFESGDVASSGFTGNIFWQSDDNGITVPILGDAAKYSLALDLLSTDVVGSLPWTFKGSSQVNGKPVTIARVEQQNASPIDLYVDSQTGEYRRAVVDPDGQYESTVNFLSYGDALPGKKIPTKWKYEGSDYTHALTKITANAPVSAGDLHPPLQRASWTFANANPFPIKVTQYRFIVNATINGVAGTFILDTGADGIFLSDDFARRAHIVQVGHEVVGGLTGSLKERTGRADTILIGGNTLSNVMLNYGGEPLDKEAPDGALGFDVLGAAVVTLDIANATMQIQDPSTANLQGVNGVRVAVDLSSGQPRVPMKINASAPVTVLLDSGAPGHMLFAPGLITKYHLRMLIDNSQIGYFSSHAAVGGVNGTYQIDECGYLESVALGPIVYDHAPACKSPSFDGENALVGFDFLKGFSKITFGYPQSWIVFTPSAQ